MTLNEFRAEHGDPQDWCSAEIDEYLSVCDTVEATPGPLDLDVAHMLIGGMTRSGKGGAR
ncbi:hypothetical protein OIC43_31050 [Streptomyces sp. NBC_00825]|uniref:hypothetical protein n=1 Tax=unclassified Streptomyces TaxID=2593676 RepID=UPI002ED0305B|nr:hypothetical protein OG832_12635 [Streptomyces sp. NBC_00826]WTH93153.1 hypothetical protein OIC43_31050 [Streptomyces sp. NBC_00825]WTI01885.1 hypothetical protein OHA23_31030 [Streptomyces sp. NBC_00822]